MHVKIWGFYIQNFNQLKYFFSNNGYDNPCEDESHVVLLEELAPFLIILLMWTTLTLLAIC